MKKLISSLAVIAGFAVVAVAGAAPATLTLKAAPTTVVYGATSALTGVLSTQRSGQTITVQAQECGKTKFSAVADAKTTTGGAFSFAAKPTVNTAYRAKFKGATSPNAGVTVKPQLRLKKLTSSRYRATLTAGVSFASKYVNLQRYNASTRKWKTVTRVTFKTGQASGAAPTTVSTGTKRVRLKKRLKVRLQLPQAQAGCYLATTSNSTRS
ncbi:MAG: hypothetical protein M3R70_08895 [Actinomycetota bacterium]|nr:hypothetical protein [Actinomycetota bacterium]